jgi:serine/threonine protein kinase
MHSGAQVGAYRILERIGVGGMGSVWLGEHVMLGRKAAIKLLHAEMSSRRDIVKRFFNEARAATAIADPGIVQIFDFGYHEDGSAYIVMELLEGEPLDKRLERVGRFEITEALRIMRQVTTAVGAAHARGIIHRDLKPDNIYLVKDPEVVGGERVKILDFGIAKLLDEYNSMNAPSGVFGTPLYMAPEQCRGTEKVDHRADIYALGCMLFALLTGGPPFQEGVAGVIMSLQMDEPAPAPSTRAPNIPGAVDALVLRCLAKTPQERFQTAGELASEITSALTTLRASTGPMEPREATAPIAPQPPSLTSAPTAAFRPVSVPRRNVMPYAGAAIAAGALLALVVWQVSDSSPPAVAASPAPTPTPVVAPAPPPPPHVDPPAPDPREQLTTTVADVMQKFVDWSHAHKGGACPDLAAIGAAATDPWGTALVLTCTDQPHNQIVGVISAGPDGKLGTEDDIGSWQLDRRVTDLVHGSPWVAHATVRTKTHPITHPRSDQPKITLDENGVPIHR